MQQSQDAPSIFVPEDIRFGCTFCGHCCNTWPVPLTELDVERMSTVTGLAIDSLPLDRLSRSESQTLGTAAFTSVLTKDNGTCNFLNADKLCTLETGAKPSMCRLFPFTFLHTPEGLYTGLSFASTGVLKNSGPLLSEQAAVLNQMADLFEKLNPTLAIETAFKWQQIEFVDGHPLAYDQFVELQSELLHGVKAIMSAPLTYPKITVTRFITEFYAEMHAFVPERQALLTRMPDPLKMDGYLLESYSHVFFADKNSATKSQMLSERVGGYMSELPDLSGLKPFDLTLDDFKNSELGRLPISAEEILARYAYVRLYSRLFFGPGLNMLSFVTGLGHLCLILTLIRLKAKADLISNPQMDIYELVLETVRLVESKWTSLKYTGDTKSMLEIFFVDKDRPKRLLEMSS